MTWPEAFTVVGLWAVVGGTIVGVIWAANSGGDRDQG